MRRWVAIALLAFAVAHMVRLHSYCGAQTAETTGKRKVVNKVAPFYPELARRMNLSGAVKVEVVVAPNGSVKSTKVIGGSPVLAQAAVDAMRKWKWEPAPQETTELVELKFQPAN